MNLQKTYYVIPVSDIWNNEAIIQSLRTAYSTKAKAIEKAKKCAKNYNGDFHILSLETLVKCKIELIDSSTNVSSDDVQPCSYCNNPIAINDLYDIGDGDHICEECLRTHKAAGLI